MTTHRRPTRVLLVWLVAAAIPLCCCRLQMAIGAVAASAGLTAKAEQDGPRCCHKSEQRPDRTPRAPGSCPCGAHLKAPPDSVDFAVPVDAIGLLLPPLPAVDQHDGAAQVRFAGGPVLPDRVRPGQTLLRMHCALLL